MPLRLPPYARALWCMVLATAACSADPVARTQVMVLVEADESVRRDTRRLTVDVYGGPSNAADNALVLADAYEFETVEAGFDWPVRIALVPREGDATRRYRVEATALDPSGNTVVRSTVRSGYVAQRTLQLVVRLRERCRGRSRSDGVCAPQDVDAGELPEYDPAPSRDAGPRDGDVDAARDADTQPDASRDGSQDAEAGADAAPAECTSNAQCRDIDPCNGLESCKDGVCIKGEPPQCAEDTNPCTTAVCIENSGCAQQNNTHSCDDDDPCTTDDVCSGGSCSGTAIRCGSNESCQGGDCVCNGGYVRCGDACQAGLCCNGIMDGGCVCGGMRVCVDGGWRCQNQSGNCIGHRGASCTGSDCLNQPFPGVACDPGSRIECMDNGSACNWSGCF